MIALKYIFHSHRNAETLFLYDSRYINLWNEIINTIEGISDTDLISSFNSNTHGSKKSISKDINSLMDERLSKLGWNRESPIFNDSEYKNERRWRLDFAKEEISVEVAFNHGEATAWNLIKPVLAGELNHVEKDIQTSAGVIVTATDAMKKAGNFDSAVGSFEKFLRYLKPLSTILTIPIMIIGLEPPTTFRINHETKSVESIL